MLRHIAALLSRPMPRGRLAVAIVGVALAASVAAAVGIPVRATHGLQTSGDEPHYLITAQSIGQDASLDVGAQYRSRRYLAYHERELPPQALHQPGDRMVAPHDPLLPALLAGPIALGGWVAAKVTLALLAGILAGLLLWIAVRRFAIPPWTAAAVILPLVVSAPLAVYGSQIYPELPAALAVTIAIAALTGRPARAGAVLALGVAVTALPWLAVKFVPVAATLAALGLARLWRSGERRMAGRLAGGLAIAAVVYVVAHLAWYGGLTVYAAGRFFVENGGQLAVTGTDPNYAGRATRLIGLLVDRNFGLGAWQPAWLLLVPAAVALLRRRPAGWSALAAPLAIGWLVATFVAATMHGFWFPGRQVVVVLPAGALMLAWWAARGRVRLVVAVALAAIGAIGYAVLVVEGVRGQITWVVDFFATGAPWFEMWQLALPDYMDPGAATWIRHGLWLAAFTSLAALAWSHERVTKARLPLTTPIP